jgi:transcriptional regulator with XRE-family HTH domain
MIQRKDIVSIMVDIHSRGPSDINARLARRVGGRRAELGLSLDALAARTGVSRSMLSLVERGESSATATVLEKIAGGLGLPLARLFDDPAATPNPRARRAEQAVWRDPASGYVRRSVSPANFPSAIRIVEVLLPPGAAVSYETGPRVPVVHQQIWMREGRMEFTLGRQTHALGPGDCLAMILDAPTVFRNRTRRKCRYVVVVVTEAPRGRRS